MRYLPLLLISTCLLIAACKKKDDTPTDPYAWVDDYCGKYNVIVQEKAIDTKSGGGINNSKTYNAVANITNLHKTEIPKLQMWHSTDTTTPRPKIKLTVEGSDSFSVEMFVEITNTGAFLFSSYLTYAKIKNNYLDYDQDNSGPGFTSTTKITGYKAK